jgi:hypothetical protein
MTPSTSAVAVCWLQRLARLSDEPRILHRDDRLRREVLQERNLLGRERSHLGAKSGNDAEQLIVVPKRGPYEVRAPVVSTKLRRIGSPDR